MKKQHGPEYVGGLLAGPVKPDMTQKHTPGPWQVMMDYAPARGSVAAARLYSVDANVFLADFTQYPRGLADARRAAACVTACEGIENPAAVPELVKAAEAAREYYSESFRICVLCAARHACKRLCAALAAVKAAPGRGGESLT